MEETFEDLLDKIPRFPGISGVFWDIYIQHRLSGLLRIFQLFCLQEDSERRTIRSQHR
jgi:hypothetical protein